MASAGASPRPAAAECLSPARPSASLGSSCSSNSGEGLGTSTPVPRSNGSFDPFVWAFFGAGPVQWPTLSGKSSDSFWPTHSGSEFNSLTVRDY